MKQAFDFILLFSSPWTTLAAALAAYLLSVSLYRLFFHPLRNIPGPTFAAITWYYQGYYEFWRDGDMVRQLVKLHKKYGPVVRIGPNDLHFSDPKVYASIYAVGSKLRKDPKLYNAFDEDETSFACTDPKQAKARKDVLNPMFSRRSILKLETVIQEKVDLFLSQVVSPQYNGKPVNLYLALRSLSLDVMSSYCFSRTYNALAVPKFEHPILLSMEATIPMWFLLKYLPCMKIILQFPDWLTLYLNPASKGFIDLRRSILSQIDELLADPSRLESAEQQNIFHQLFFPKNVKGQYQIPPRKELAEEAINLLIAGSDTVGNTVTVGSFHVLDKPDICAKLVAELQEAWPDSDSTMLYENLEKLPYLTAVIKESLRLSQGVTIPLPRLIPPGLSMNLLGLDLPAGTVVSIGATFVHLNEDIFPNPRQFDPERWLQPDSRSLENYLVAFSRGPRSCLGINLAWCELYLIFANIFRKLDLTLFETSVEDMEVRDHFVPVYRRRQLQALAKPKPL